MTAKKLTSKQKQFVDEYLVDLNATEAAKRAGYSAKTASSIGSENLRKPEIEEEVHRRMQERGQRVEITQDLVVQHLYDLYQTCATKYPNLDMMGEPVYSQDGKPVMKVVDATNARGALDMLMKHLGAYDKDNKQKFTGIKIVWGGDDEGDGSNTDSDDPV